MTPNVNISVRSLVEYVYRSGSIESGFRTSRALTEGTKAHQKVQKQYGESDQHEVYVSAEIAYEDLLFVIDGRCDGLLMDADGETVTVDEIKSTSSDIGQIEEDSYPVHWAQAKCYAYMVAKDRGLSRMRIQLTYMQVDTEETRRFVDGSVIRASLNSSCLTWWSGIILMHRRDMSMNSAGIRVSRSCLSLSECIVKGSGSWPVRCTKR